jgi:hypothetical protein
VIFPLICNFDVGLDIPIPTFHQVLNIFVSLVIQEAQSRYGVAHRVPACNNQVAPVAPVSPVAPVAHAGHAGPPNANQLIKSYIAQLVEVIKVPLALVPSTAIFGKTGKLIFPSSRTVIAFQALIPVLVHIPISKRLLGYHILYVHIASE